MELEEILKDKTIIICENSYKKYFLKAISERHLLLDIKIFTKDEFLKEYLFSYKEEALYYLTSKYHYKIEVALMYLNNLIYIEDKDYHHPKLKFLKDLKKELEANNLLKYNPDFKEYIKNYHLVVVGYPPLMSNELKIFNNLNANLINNKPLYEVINVYEYKTSEEEVNGVLKQICHLINKGIDINKIKLVNVSKDYYNILERFSFLYHLPIKRLNKVALINSLVTKKFLDHLDEGMDKALSYIENENEDILDKIITICNKYLFVKELAILKNLLIYEFKNTYLKSDELKNYIDIIEIDDYIDANDYVFLINFNTSSIPKVMKDEDYLDEEVKEEINLTKSYEYNLLYKNYLIERLKSIKNLFISYKLQDLQNSYFPSILINEIHLQVIKYNDNLLESYSILNDKINYAKSLYNYETYNINNNLDLYQNTLGNINYNSYDNTFKGINEFDLKEYLHNELNLSYSSLNNYHKCAFRYYLTNILKIDKYEDTFEGFIGSLFHDVLAKCLYSNLEVDEEINNYLKLTNKELSSKEAFFINKIKDDIAFVKKTIISQSKDISLDQTYLEKLITIDKSREDIKIIFKGYIDKILYKEDKDQTYLAIIDYKTGSVSSSLKYVPYGFDMQLPIYLYLVKRSSIFTNPSVIGFYLQFILNNNILRDNNKCLEEIKRDNLKLVGYSTDKIASLILFDKSYQNSNLISGLKVKNDGSFYKNAKVLSEDKIDDLVNLTEEIIDRDITNILKGNFTINPKKIGYDKEVGCTYCHFKDICYKKSQDEVILEEIGGE